MSEYIRVSAWIGVPELLAELGADPAAVLAEAGLTLQDLKTPENYLPVRAFARTANAANRATGRTDFGMLSAMHGGHRTLGMLGIAARNAGTMRNAIELGSQFIDIHRPGGKMTLVPIPRSSNEFLEIEIADLDDPEMLQIPERILAMTYKVNKFFSSEAFGPLEFHFTHQPISPMGRYVDVFGIAPKFGQVAVGMVLKSSQLDEPLPNRSSELSDLATSHLQSIASRRGGELPDKARVITRLLVELGDCHPGDLAAALGVEERTLQRQLREHGTSFEALRDEARRQIADVMLRQGRKSVTDLALMLGFSDATSFTRSCKRWFGATPTQIRAERKCS